MGGSSAIRHMLELTDMLEALQAAAKGPIATLRGKVRGDAAESVPLCQLGLMRRQFQVDK
jgi:hypothetical protein